MGPMDGQEGWGQGKHWDAWPEGPHGLEDAGHLPLLGTGCPPLLTLGLGPGTKAASSEKEGAT